MPEADGAQAGEHCRSLGVSSKRAGRAVVLFVACEFGRHTYGSRHIRGLQFGPGSRCFLGPLSLLRGHGRIELALHRGVGALESLEHDARGVLGLGRNLNACAEQLPVVGS